MSAAASTGGQHSHPPRLFRPHVGGQPRTLRPRLPGGACPLADDPRSHHPSAPAHHRVSLTIRCAACGGWVDRLDVPLCALIRPGGWLSLLCGWGHGPEFRADIDGTLLLSNEAHARAWVEALAEHGYTHDVAHLCSLIGMGGDKIMPDVTNGLSDKEGVGKEIAQRRKEIFLSRYAPTLQPAPGARALLTHLRHAGLMLVVATSAKAAELEMLLKAADVADLIQEEVTSDDAEHAKPDPDIIDAALAKAGMRPEQAIMLGDTPYDVQAAHKAGVRTIALCCGGWDVAHLSDAGAVAVYADPADLLAHYDSSPLGHGAPERTTKG